MFVTVKATFHCVKTLSILIAIKQTAGVKFYQANSCCEIPSSKQLVWNSMNQVAKRLRLRQEEYWLKVRRLTCILLATVLPSWRTPLCTWPIDAAANGLSSKLAYFSFQSGPNSVFITLWRHEDKKWTPGKLLNKDWIYSILLTSNNLLLIQNIYKSLKS